MSTTERVGHARDMAQTDALLDGIIVAGGDGLFNETVNGLLRRADGRMVRRSSLSSSQHPIATGRSMVRSNTAPHLSDDFSLTFVAVNHIQTLKVPIGQLPSGSTNTVAWSVHANQS